MSGGKTLDVGGKTLGGKMLPTRLGSQVLSVVACVIVIGYSDVVNSV